MAHIYYLDLRVSLLHVRPVVIASASQDTSVTFLTPGLCFVRW